MAIDSVHPEYAAMRDDWRRMRDVLGGQRAMRTNAAEYIRRPMGMNDNEEWARYVNATEFFEATLRTQEGLVGLAFYRDPEINLPAGMDAFVKDVTGDGVPLRQFLESTFEEVNGMGRVGVICEHPPLDPTITNLLQQERAGIRPFLRRYATETIFNWATLTINGMPVLSEVRLWETETEKVGEWGHRVRRRIRILQLEKQADGTLQYVQRVFVHKDWDDVDGTEAAPGDGVAGGAPASLPGTGTEPAESWEEDISMRRVPLMDGKPMNYIPFWIINPTDQSPKMRRPPMLGLANANIGHFKTTASLENALFWSGNPQPYITGIDPESTDTFVAGSSTAWLFKNPQTQVGFLSFGADQLAPLEKRLDRIEQHMALLGARMLSADKAGVEAAETARIHRQGEVSVLAGVCGSVSRAFTDIVGVACRWKGADDANAMIRILTAFYDETISAEDALRLTELWQKGVIDFDDLLAALKKGSIVSADRTAEDIKSRNETSPIQPIMPGLTAGTGTTAPTPIAA